MRHRITDDVGFLQRRKGIGRSPLSFRQRSQLGGKLRPTRISMKVMLAGREQPNSGHKKSVHGAVARW